VTDPETPSPVFVDPSGRRRRVLIVILATAGSIAVGYLALLLLSALGAPLPPVAKVPLPPGVRDSAPPSTTRPGERGSESPTAGSETPGGVNSPGATSPAGSGIPGSPGATTGPATTPQLPATTPQLPVPTPQLPATTVPPVPTTTDLPLPPLTTSPAAGPDVTTAGTAPGPAPLSGSVTRTI
jgi:hypothetical protein